jgi:hypothetical protein
MNNIACAHLSTTTGVTSTVEWESCRDCGEYWEAELWSPWDGNEDAGFEEGLFGDC